MYTSAQQVAEHIRNERAHEYINSTWKAMRQKSFSSIWKAALASPVCVHFAYCQTATTLLAAYHYYC
jgi:hypothetical protein